MYAKNEKRQDIERMAIKWKTARRKTEIYSWLVGHNQNWFN